MRLLGASHSSAPPPPLANVDTATAFIGREGQLQTLREAFDAARAGRSITVRVAGAPGIGKSTIVHHFLDAIVWIGEAVVLRGRAYEREEVPYKAVDTLIDALSRHLLRLVEAGEPPELPHDIGALIQMFPVLRRVPTVAARADEPAGPGDLPAASVRRAARALQVARSTAAARPLRRRRAVGRRRQRHPPARGAEATRRASPSPADDPSGRRGGGGIALPARDTRALARARRVAGRSRRPPRDGGRAPPRADPARVGRRAVTSYRARRCAGIARQPLPHRGADTQQPRRREPGGVDPERPGRSISWSARGSIG